AGGAMRGSGSGLARVLEDDRRPGELLVPLLPTDLAAHLQLVALRGSGAAPEDRDPDVAGREVVRGLTEVGGHRAGHRADDAHLLPRVGLRGTDDVGDGRGTGSRRSAGDDD